VRDPAIRVPARRVVVLAAFAIVVFWFARPVILPFAVAAIIAYAFSPYIDRVQARTHRSRLLIVVLCYGTALLAIVALVIAFANPVYREVVLLARAGPDALETALRQVIGPEGIVIGDQHFTVEALAVQLEAAARTYLQTPEGAIRAAEQLLHGTLDMVLILFVTFFLLLDGAKLSNTALNFLQPADRVELRRVAGRIHVVVGRWLRGQLVLMAFVGTVVTIVFAFVLHLPYPLALGLLVAVLEVITFIGPIIAGTVVGIVALSSGGPTLALTAVVFLFVLRQIEDVVIMPNVLGRAVHLHPLVALFAVVVGSTAFGIVGTFLALPVAAAISVALHEFFPAELGAIPEEDVAAAARSGAVGRSPADAPEVPAGR
jgi:predicted PurR-regulated permease PerM